jgi:DMSO/TMAO reductase YedYZ molybdopterin-dependent catalytic subunit
MLKRFVSFTALILALALIAACAGPATAPAAPAPAAPAPAPAAPAPEAPAPEAPADDSAGIPIGDIDLVVLTPAAAHGWIAGTIFFAEQKVQNCVRKA